jgi:predicted O-methyltransferase YrrM
MAEKRLKRPRDAAWRVLARHAEPSAVLSLDDETFRPSQRLYGLAAELARETPIAKHPMFASRRSNESRWYETFPGEHYHLLTTICRLLKPRSVWEFGTFTGMGTVAMLEGLEKNAKLYAVDIIPYQAIEGTWLEAEDFENGRTIQILSDMKSPKLFSEHAEEIADAELLFVDGPKDGLTEPEFFSLLDKVPFRRNPIVVVDDIRLMNMLAVWRGIHHPKMDFTSYGHWSGTGLVDWSSSPN